MKPSRYENVNMTLGRYLKTRKYSEGDAFKKCELKVQQTLHEMTFGGQVELATSSKNAISFSSISGDATAIDQQFSRLKMFVSEASEPFKSELTYLMFPMFVHLYLELITNGQKTAAQKFHSRHINLFTDSEEFSKTVENLGEIQTVQDINNHWKVKVFRDNKYSIKFTDDCYEYLLRFLRNIEHLTLLQVLNLCFDVEILQRDLSSPESCCTKAKSRSNSPETRVKEEEENSEGQVMGSEPIRPAQSGAPPPQEHPQVDQEMEETTDVKTVNPAQVSTTNKESALNALKESTRKVRESPPCLPSICLCTVQDAFQGLCSACLSHKETMLATGMEDCSIRLWSLTPDLLYSHHTPVNVSNVRLAYDHAFEYPDETKDDLMGQEMKVMRAHSGPVYGLEFVANSDMLISCSQDATVRGWSLKTHTNIALYRGHSYPVFDVASCPQGLYFATASADTTCRIWTPDRIYPLRILAGHNMDVDCVQFHPNSNYVASGSSDRSVRLWNVQDGRLVRLFQGHRANILSLAFSPNGKLLASAGEDRRIKIWDIASGSSIKELRGHTDTIYSLCFSRDSSILASSGLEHSLKLWDILHSHPTTAADSNDTFSVGESHSSPELLASYPTNCTSVPYLKFSIRNTLFAVGVHQSNE